MVDALYIQSRPFLIWLQKYRLAFFIVDMLAHSLIGLL
jgi:hypothetical protein